jgi:hypothetical protein
MAACPPDGDGDVITLALCPPTDAGTHCTEPLVADGRASVVLRACTGASERKDNTLVTLDSTEGRFANPKAPDSPTTQELRVGAQDCADATLVMPRRAGFVRVDADLGGFHPHPVWIGVPAASIENISIIPVPPVLVAKEPSTIALSVHASSPGGAGSTLGTSAEITVMPTPHDAYARAYPSQLVLDDESNGEFTLFASAEVSSVTIQIKVSPPASEGLQTPQFKTVTVQLEGVPAAE